MKARAGIRSVEVGFGPLQVLGDSAGPLMLRDLARAANMSAAKAHRRPVSFQRLPLVVQDAAGTRHDLGRPRSSRHRPVLPRPRLARSDRAHAEG